MILAAQNQEFVIKRAANVSVNPVTEEIDVIFAYWVIMVIPTANLATAVK